MDPNLNKSSSNKTESREKNLNPLSKGFESPKMQTYSNLEKRIRISMERDLNPSIQDSNRKLAQEKNSNPQDERFESFNEKVETRSKDLNPQQE